MFLIPEKSFVPKKSRPPPDWNPVSAPDYGSSYIGAHVKKYSLLFGQFKTFDSIESSHESSFPSCVRNMFWVAIYCKHHGSTSHRLFSIRYPQRERQRERENFDKNESKETVSLDYLLCFEGFFSKRVFSTCRAVNLSSMGLGKIYNANYFLPWWNLFLYFKKIRQNTFV